VACIVVDVGDTTQDPGVGDTLRAIAGEDVRIEQLAVGKTVGVLGVEHSRGDEVMRAARAALQIMQEFPQARAVVSNGHAVTARSNLAGEALDRAARQLENAQHGGVRLDLHAAAALETRFEIQRDGHGAHLIREDLRDLTPRNVVGRPTPTVGREKEIALLQSLYVEMLRDSFPRAAVISGPAGIGKSRVRSELIQRLELAPVPPETIICRGDSMAGGSVSALGKALRATMGVQDGANHHDQVQLVKRFVRARLPRSLHFLGAFMGELIGVPFPDQNDEPLAAARANDQLMQSRVRMALEAYLRTQAGRIPQIIIIEDAHAADDTTMELMDWVLGCPEIRICVFAFAQPEITLRRPNLWAKARKATIALGPLPDDMAERLVAGVLPNCGAAVTTRLVRRAAGNPFVLEELIRATSEGSHELPLSVLAMVQRRLDRLDPSVREVVRAASVFGRTFWSGGLCALLDRAVDDDLVSAEKEELIYRQTSSNVAGQTEYAFRQALVREAAHASLLAEDRTGLHLATGDWLESVGCVDLGLIAHHFELGGDRGRAASLYARATQQVLANFGHMDSALDLAQRGLRCGAEGSERGQLLLTQAHVFNRRGRLSESIEAAEESAKLVPPASDMWVEAQRLLSESLIESGRATEGDARLSWALGSKFSHKLSPRTRSLLLAARVRALIDLNRTAE
ncbi:MAG TPA: serine/threonine-protein kinase PknK, partial [Sorangium sp.]|nr:serine/threonine-protein kinase PknK [Sorangium sp.]